MRFASSALAVMLLLTAGTAAGDAPVREGAFRVDGVVALVGRAGQGQRADVILRTDVELLARLSLLGAGVAEAARVEIPPAVLGAAYEQILGEVLIAREAERVRVPAPGASDITLERSRLTRDAGGEGALAQLLSDLNANPDELETIAARRALVTAFLRINLEGTAVATDAEVDNVFDAGDHPFVGQGVEEIREELRALIGQRALQRAVRRWVSVLKARTRIQVLVQYVDAEADA